MKRFRVIEVVDYRVVVAKCDTLLEVVEYVHGVEEHIHPQYLYVECLVDDITINCDELLGSFEDGESPLDLQYF